MSNWKEIHQNLFINIATALNKKEIQWTILRNYSELPKKNSSKDIDISISYSEKEEVINIIEEVLYNCNFKFKKLIKFSFCYSFVYFNIDENNNEVESIKIDLFWGLQLKSYLMASSEEIYENSIDFGLFKGAENSLSVVFNLVSPIISNGVIREKYIQPFIDEYKINKINVQKWLSSIMDEEILNNLENIINSNDLKGIHSLIPKIRTSILNKTSKKQPFRKKFNTILRWYFRTNQFLNDLGGGFISFHGTTENERILIIEGFAKKYSDVLIIDEDAILFKSFYSENLKITKKYEEGMIKNKSFFSSLKVLSFITKKYIKEYFFKTKKEILYHKTIIYNLYISDILINSKFLNLNLPYWIKKFFIKVTPSPEIYFYIESSNQTSKFQNGNLPLEGKNYESIKSNGFIILGCDNSLEQNINIAITQYIKKSSIKINRNN